MTTRRQLIAGLGAAAAWPLAARAQQPAMPVVGFLHASSAAALQKEMTAFRIGLREAGYADGQNIVIEFRWAEGHYDRLPGLAVDLVRQEVAVIAAAPLLSAVMAKQATSVIPIIFESGADPVRLGLVASLNRPGGNITGIFNLSNTVMAKRVQLMHQIVPNTHLIAVLLNPDNPNFETQMEDVRAAQEPLSIQLVFLLAHTVDEIEAAFSRIGEMRVGALIVGSDPFFVSVSSEIATLSTRYAVPTSHESREFVAAGGLISYGSDLADVYRLWGGYTGRILKGEKPADLPVQQATKIELAINVRTAKTLGVTVPLPLLATADEVIE